MVVFRDDRDDVTAPEDFLRYAAIFTPIWGAVSKEKIVSERLSRRYCTGDGPVDPACYEASTERSYGLRWFGHYPDKNTAQWDHAFNDGALFKHGNMGQGLYVDPKRDFVAATLVLLRMTRLLPERIRVLASRALPPRSCLAFRVFLGINLMKR